MYNSRNGGNGADEIMRRLMEITNRGETTSPSIENFERSRRSVHSIPEDREMYRNGNGAAARPMQDSMRDNMRDNMRENVQNNARMIPDNGTTPEKPDNDKENGCDWDKNDFCKNMKPGYAFVKPQKFDNIYEPAKALKRGTMFGVLDLPKNVYEMKGEM